MEKYLTKREKDILGFISDFSIDHGFAPSLDEIREAMGLSSISTVHEHVSRLICKGFLEKHPNKARSMQLKDFSAPNLKITTLQDIINKTSRDLGSLKMNKIFGRNSDCVAVAIQGKSLEEEGVRDGDFVIAIPGNGIMDGDTIIGLIDGYKPILGKLFHFGTKIVIKPSDSKKDSAVINPESVVIVGRVKGVFRKF